MNKLIKSRIYIIMMCIIGILTAFPVYANENMSDTTEVVEQEQHIILTQLDDGSVIESVYTYSPSSVSPYQINNELVAPGYFPMENVSEEIFVNSLLSDSTGRTQLTGSNVEARVGYLECGFDVDGDGTVDEYYYGTASLQNHDILISCAHNIWSKHLSGNSSQGWAKTVVFYAGRTSQNKYVATASKISMSIGMDFVNNSTTGYDTNGNLISRPYYNDDWSIIQINKDLGSTYGWFGLHGCSASAEKGISIEMIGYPYDKNGYQQWKSEGTLNSFSGNIVRHSAYVVIGTSGSPLLNNGSVYAIQTHIYGDAEKGGRDAGATRIADWLFSMIVTAREESEARWP